MEIIMKTLKWFAYVFAIVFIVGCGKEDPIPDRPQLLLVKEG